MSPSVVPTWSLEQLWEALGEAADLVVVVDQPVGRLGIVVQDQARLGTRQPLVRLEVQVQGPPFDGQDGAAVLGEGEAHIHAAQAVPTRPATTGSDCQMPVLGGPNLSSA